MSNNINKLVEQIGSMSVLELSELVKTLETTFGVSAAMPVAAAVAAPVADAPAKEEKSEYKVTLKSYTDAKKIDVIKALRKALPELSLTDAKAAVEGVPTVLAEAAQKDVANKIKQTLEETGAAVVELA